MTMPGSCGTGLSRSRGRHARRDGRHFCPGAKQALPMQDTAIESEVPPDEAKRFATLDDRAFRDALKERGIAYFASLNFGFDPNSSPPIRKRCQSINSAGGKRRSTGTSACRRTGGEYCSQVGLLERAVRARARWRASGLHPVAGILGDLAAGYSARGHAGLLLWPETLARFCGRRLSICR